jgi:hypothetical protein
MTFIPDVYGVVTPEKLAKQPNYMIEYVASLTRQIADLTAQVERLSKDATQVNTVSVDYRTAEMSEQPVGDFPTVRQRFGDFVWTVEFGGDRLSVVGSVKGDSRMVVVPHVSNSIEVRCVEL